MFWTQEAEDIFTKDKLSLQNWQKQLMINKTAVCLNASSWGKHLRRVQSPTEQLSSKFIFPNSSFFSHSTK